MIIILYVYIITYFVFLHVIIVLSFPNRTQKLRLSTLFITKG